MDETTLMTLIAEGEAIGRVEFKRELHLVLQRKVDSKKQGSLR